METKRPYMRVCACRYVAAPDHPEAGCRFLPLVRGPVTIQGVRDPMGGPGPNGGSGIPWGSGPPREVRSLRLSGLSARFLRNTWRSRTFPSHESGPEPLPGEQDSGPPGSGCLDVVKDNYKALA